MLRAFVGGGRPQATHQLAKQMLQLQGEELARFARAFWFSPGVPLILLNELVQMYQLFQVKTLCPGVAEGALAVSALFLQASRAEDVAEDMARSGILVYMVPILECASIPGEVRRRLLETMAVCLRAGDDPARQAPSEQPRPRSDSANFSPASAPGLLQLQSACLGQLASFGFPRVLCRYLSEDAPEGCEGPAFSLVCLYGAFQDCLADAQLAEFIQDLAEAAVTVLGEGTAEGERCARVREALQAVCGGRGLAGLAGSPSLSQPPGPQVGVALGAEKWAWPAASPGRQALPQSFSFTSESSEPSSFAAGAAPWASGPGRAPPTRDPLALLKTALRDRLATGADPEGEKTEITTYLTRLGLTD